MLAGGVSMAAQVWRGTHASGMLLIQKQHASGVRTCAYFGVAIRRAKIHS